jgi:serralysin
VIGLMNYVGSITGIKFTLTADGAAADFHFADCDISNPSFGGYTRWNWNYKNNGAQQITSYTADAYVFIDTIEYSRQLTPTVSNGGIELLLHEIGHAMGLKHPFAGEPRLSSADDDTMHTLMSYTRVGSNKSTYSPFDLDALMYLYGGDGLGGALGQGGKGLYLIGDEVPETLNGGTGHDVLQGGGGDDMLQGGAGIDTAVYSQARNQYTLSQKATRISGATDGADTLTQVERLRFSDMSLAIDLAGNAGSTAQILRAIFGSSALANKTYVGIGLSLFDGGMAYADIVALAIATAEFQQLAGSHSNTAFVNTVYRNVVGVAPTAAERDSFVSLLDNGTYTQTSLGVLAAQTGLNAQSVEITGLADTGVPFTPVG